MPNGVQILPTLDRFAGLRQGAQNFVRGLAQQQQQRQQLSDTQALLQFIQQKQQGLSPGLPQFQTPGVAGAAIQFLGQQQPTAQPGFTLSPGQERFTATGQRIAQVEPIPTKPTTSFQQIPDPTTGQITNALINTQTGDIIKSFGETDALTSKDKAQIAVTQAKEFRADERVTNLNIIERSERGMQAALKQSKTAKSRIASDQALGVLFQKMLDPTSVVRESEFARTPQGAALLNRVIGGADQLVKGGLALKDEDRDALVVMAQKLLDEAKITANKAFSEFEVRADELGLNKKVIFGGAKPFDIKPSGTTPSRARIFGGQTELQRIDAEIAELERLQ